MRVKMKAETVCYVYVYDCVSCIKSPQKTALIHTTELKLYTCIFIVEYSLRLSQADFSSWSFWCLLCMFWCAMFYIFISDLRHVYICTQHKTYIFNRDMLGLGLSQRTFWNETTHTNR